MSCQHSPSRVSVGGYYTCQWCFERVLHPWASSIEFIVKLDKARKLAITETGIERMEREQEDWPARMGVKL